jgi:ribosome biogenesis protein MAK21
VKRLTQGDNSKKIAAKASYFILKLESAHPQMKSIILHEMENLIFRPNTSIHAHYYAIITMNQTILTSRDVAVANRLVEVYFMLFVKLLRKDFTRQENSNPKKKIRGKKRRGAVKWEELNPQEEEVNSKTLSAVLTGVNRAFPFSKVESDVFEKHMDILFMITHDGNFNTAIQALILIFQVATAKEVVTHADKLT